VIDLFSGTTVVAQALAKSGFRVTTVDAMSYTSSFATALLSVGRGADDFDEEAILGALHPRAAPSRVSTAFEHWLAAEAEALKNRDSDALFDVSLDVPQVWRPEGADGRQRQLFDEAVERRGQTAFDFGAVISTHYAGTYFGVAQAVELDRLRVGIQSLRASGRVNEWEEAVLLTALLSVASDCVFSPGKHFAQPHLIRGGKDLSFLRGRVLQDRGVDVWRLFSQRVTTVLRRAAPAGGGHSVYRSTFESFLEDSAPLRGADLIYADPPYTAQQYSRFYHVPETLVTYRAPQLQYVRGQVTRGLYPDDKFKSRFSSKREAPRAFRDLLDLSKRLGSKLLVSYSGTSSGLTGNDRMIGFEALLSLCREQAGADGVRVYEFDHEYRQFNHRNTAVNGRLDKEYLILCDRV
jgi:hypothetical protein